MERHEDMQLLHGDCLELMKGIPDKSVDMILCDLPYGTTACAWDSIIPVNSLWEQYKRIIKRGGIIALFGSEPFSTMLRAANLDWFKYDWIWEKEQSSSGLTAQTQPLKKHEIISVFYQTYSEAYDTTNMFDALKDYMISEREKCGLLSKEIRNLLGSYMASHYFTRKTQFCIPTKDAYEKLQTTGYFQKPFAEIEAEYKKEREKAYICVNTYNPQMTEGEPYKGHYAPDAQVHGNGEHFVKDNNGTRFPTSIIKFNRACGLHPTQKPVPLLEYLIRTYTNDGETVLDNCMGSGSTGVACVQTGRDFIGIELDDNYFEIAQKRIYEAQEALDGKA